MRHPLLRNLDVGQEPRGKQTSVSLPAGSFLHYVCTGVPSFASGFLCNGAWGSICVLHCSPAHWFVGMLLLLHVCLAGTLSHQISAVSISELLLQGTVSDFVSSGAEWSRSLYSFMRRGHTHCIYCDRLAEWFGSLWAYQSSCFSLHQPGRLLSDEYMNSFDFRWKWSHEIFTQVCNLCT